MAALHAHPQAAGVQGAARGALQYDICARHRRRGTGTQAAGGAGVWAKGSRRCSLLEHPGDAEVQQRGAAAGDRPH